MVSISYFLKFGFGPSSSVANAGHAQDASHVSGTVSVTPFDSPSASSEVDDIELASVFLPNHDLTDAEDDTPGVQANNASTSSHLCDFQPWHTTIWKPHGIGRDLPWTPDMNTWDNLLVIPPLAQIPPMWTGFPKLEQPRPYRPAALTHLDEIAHMWCDNIDMSSKACGSKQDASLAAEAEIPPCALKVNNADEAHPEGNSGTKMPLVVFRKQVSYYESPDPRDLPPPNFVLGKFHRGSRLCFLRPSELSQGHVDDQTSCQNPAIYLQSMEDDDGYDADVDDDQAFKPPRKLCHFDVTLAALRERLGR